MGVLLYKKSAAGFPAAETVLLDCFDLDGVGVAGLAVDGAAGHDDIVTGLQTQHLLGCLLGIVCRG